LGEVKINLGCGAKKHWMDEVGLDLERSVKPTVLCDLNRSIPLKDDCTDKVYSSHFLEHVEDPSKVLREVVRVCKHGAQVEIVVPYWSFEASMFPSHKHTLPPEYWRQIQEHRSIHFDKNGYMKVKNVTYCYTDYGVAFCQRLGITPEEGRLHLNNIVHEMTVHLEVVKHEGVL
jgi:predicted SAM-dependent methyltransferase